MRPRHSISRPRSLTPTFDQARYPAPLLDRVARRWQQLANDEQDALIAATLVATDLAIRELEKILQIDPAAADAADELRRLRDGR